MLKISVSVGTRLVKSLVIAIVEEFTNQIVKAIAKEIVKISAKQAGKSAGKSALMKVAVAGLIVGTVFGVVRLASGDPLGALGEIASGAASTIPGVGTAASIAIDAAMISRDLAVEVQRLQVRYKGLDSPKSALCLSSLHCTISISFCSFSCSGVCFNGLNLSISYIIVSQKGSNGNGKLRFFGRDYKLIEALQNTG